MAGVYRGTTYDQDPHYRNKEKKLVADTKWPPEFEVSVDFKKVNLEDTVRPWVEQKIEEVLEIEDEILVNLVMCSLEEAGVCPKQLTITLTPMLESKALPFVLSLWRLLMAAAAHPRDLPQEIIDKRRQDLLKVKEQLEAQSRRLKEATKRRSRSPRKRYPSPPSDSNSSYFASSDSSPRPKRRRSHS